MDSSASAYNDQRPDIDQLKRARLPAALKEEHGEGIVMSAPDDYELLTYLLSLVCDVGLLEDQSPPNVIPWEDAIPWVQSKFSNLECCLEYYSLVFCIMTRKMLESAHFANTALLNSIEENKENFIIVFRDHEEETMLKKLDWQEKLPGLYRLLRPIYLNQDRTRLVSQLKRLFNAHLNKKLERMDKQNLEIQEAMAKMSPFFVTDMPFFPRTSQLVSEETQTGGNQLNLYNQVSNSPSQPQLPATDQSTRYGEWSTEALPSNATESHGPVNISLARGVNSGLPATMLQIVRVQQQANCLSNADTFSTAATSAGILSLHGGAYGGNDNLDAGLMAGAADDNGNTLGDFSSDENQTPRGPPNSRYSPAIGASTYRIGSHRNMNSNDLNNAQSLQLREDNQNPSLAKMPESTYGFVKPMGGFLAGAGLVFAIAYLRYK